jgi:GDP-mannose transporter
MIIVCWMLASIAMNIVNKEVAINFEATSFAIFFQMAFAVAMFTIVEWRNLKCGRWLDLLKWSVVPFFFAGMLFTSIKSLKELSLSGVLILRNILPLFTFCVEKLLYDSPARVTFTMLMSMSVALLGTIMFGFWNITVTWDGVKFVVFNCGLTVVDRILQRQFLQDPDFSVSLPLCMVWNNLIGAVLICALAYANGEIFAWSKLAHDASLTAWIFMLFACFCGCSLGYLGLKCQKVVSATTFLVLQNLSKVFLIAASMIYFGDRMWGLSAMGCTLSMVGAMWYGFERLPVETAGK